MSREKRQNERKVAHRLRPLLGIRTRRSVWSSRRRRLRRWRGWTWILAPRRSIILIRSSRFTASPGGTFSRLSLSLLACTRRRSLSLSLLLRILLGGVGSCDTSVWWLTGRGVHHHRLGILSVRRVGVMRIGIWMHRIRVLRSPSRERLWMGMLGMLGMLVWTTVRRIHDGIGWCRIMLKDLWWWWRRRLRLNDHSLLLWLLLL